MPLNLIDLLLVAILLVGALLGYARGFVVAALDLITLATSLAAAFLGYRGLGDWISPHTPTLGVWLAPLCFVGMFLGVHFLLGWGVLRLSSKLPAKVHHNALNRLLGLAPGAVNGTLHAVILAVLVLTLPLGAKIASVARDSSLAPRFAGPAEWVEVRLAPIFDPAVRRTLQAVTVQPGARESIALTFRTTQARPRPDLEASMLDLVNAERLAAGLQPVRPDPELVQVARDHSRDMLARGYFSHVTPDGKDLGYRLQKAHVGYLAAGENLAYAPTLGVAHTGLMHSPGHRANILRPQFGRLGIGVLDTGVHGLMVTQNFRN